MSTLYRCKVRKRNGEVSDGCGFEFTPTVDGPVRFTDASCPHCKHGFLRAKPEDKPTPWPLASVEVCPGVHVSADGSARGPGLEAALATAADVAVLDRFRATSLDKNRAITTTLRSYNEHDEPAAHGGYFTCIRLERDGVIIYCWSSTDEPGVSESQARRAAADAIRNGRVPS